MTPKPPKPRKCKVCATIYTPARIGQKVCGPVCALSLVRKDNARTEAIKAMVERKADKAKRESLKTRSDWAKDAQQAFNAYIRARDAHLPCISCGRHHDGQWHAGHYLSRGARPELAFEESNCHKQCAPCNTHLSGNLVFYRANLIAKIGLERVEWLEGPHDPVKRTVDSLKALIKTYREKRKELETS